MFGYIVPEKPEMKIKEYELFRAYYCGVCRSIGKHHGQLRRLTLSYDTAFLAVLLSAAAGERLSVRKSGVSCILLKRGMLSSTVLLWTMPQT